MIKKIFGTIACLLLASAFSVLAMMADGFYKPHEPFGMLILMAIVVLVSSLYLIDNVIYN
jgi:hypothetical protein